MILAKRGDADLFTAAAVARFCGVDLKTIHHWCAKGKLRHQKTEGNHVRVERADLVAFLREYGMPLPGELRRGRPRVFVVGGDGDARDAVAKSLAKRFVVTVFEDAVDALVAMGERAPQAVVAIAPVRGVEWAHVVERLRAGEGTGHVRVVEVGDAEGIAKVKTVVAEVLGVG